VSSERGEREEGERRRRRTRESVELLLILGSQSTVNGCESGLFVRELRVEVC